MDKIAELKMNRVFAVATPLIIIITLLTVCGIIIHKPLLNGNWNIPIIITSVAFTIVFTVLVIAVSEIKTINKRIHKELNNQRDTTMSFK